MATRTPPRKPASSPAKIERLGDAVKERRIPVPADTAEVAPPGQLGVIRQGLDETDEYISRIDNLAKNISTRLFGSLAEAPKSESELPEGELYITPVRLSFVHEGLREIETILEDVFNKL